VIRLHDLRHTYATLLFADGVPVKVASERLGHASVTMRFTAYQHVYLAWPPSGRPLRGVAPGLIDAGSITRVARRPRGPGMETLRLPDLQETGQQDF
jgi:hypothetical protein